MSLEEEIKKRIAKKNINISKFERDNNIKPHSVRNLLYGKSKNPSVQLLYTIATALECTIENLIEKTDNTDQDINLIKFLKITEEIVKNLIDKSENIKLERMFLLIREIYSYSKDKQSNEIDLPFINWLIEKQFR